jgi:hypothetical protein
MDMQGSEAMSQPARQFPIVPLIVFTASLAGPSSVWPQSGCSTADQQLIANYTQQVMSASQYGDMAALLRSSQLLYSSLSPSCRQLLQRYQSGYGGYGGYGGYVPPSQGVPQVYDHGGGAYSSGGVYCAPGSGCVGP